MVERCPKCGLEFERIEGHLTGALGINTVVSIVVLVVVVCVHMVVLCRVLCKVAAMSLICFWTWP